MLYNSSTDTEKGEGVPLLSLFLPLVAFFVSSTTATSLFLLSHFQDYLKASVVCEVKHLEGLLTDMLVLLANSTSLVKLGICKFFK